MSSAFHAYSHYLVHCEALLTARANVLQLAVQRGVETLDGRLRLPGELEIVHDRGPQFLAREWRAFVHAVGMTDVASMAHHPQSNGRDERFHRTFREEVPIDADHDLYRVRELIQAYQIYCQ